MQIIWLYECVNPKCKGRNPKFATKQEYCYVCGGKVVPVGGDKGKLCEEK